MAGFRPRPRQPELKKLLCHGTEHPDYVSQGLLHRKTEVLLTQFLPNYPHSTSPGRKNTNSPASRNRSSATVFSGFRSIQ